MWSFDNTIVWENEGSNSKNTETHNIVCFISLNVVCLLFILLTNLDYSLWQHGFAKSAKY